MTPSEDHNSSSPPSDRPDPGAWTFLSNHAHVLLLLSARPDLRVRDIADRVGITERAVQKIIAELEAGAVLTRIREGRRNRYQIHRDRPLRHPVEAHRTVGDLIRLVMSEDEA
ncbi:MAG: ArsR family transcriptional regulator [Planctomycetota bacterium]|nr:MAG: ArsR family transcriptional regulator [Planctomycetota bacterium]